MNDNSNRPTILIDLKKDRIRISRRTLHAIGNPKYILLLVNPGNRSIVILRSNKDDQNAFRLPRLQFDDKRSFELHSKALIQNLRNISTDWIGDYSYRMYGNIVKKEGIAQFYISEAMQIYGARRYYSDEI